MSIKNAYPEKPELQYLRTSVEMSLAIAHIQAAAVPVEVKRATYVYFRIESGNGRSGVNNNYAGIQADGARWPADFDAKIIGTSVKGENGTGKMRRFVCFQSYKDSIDFTISNTQRRGMYIGGNTWLISKMQVKTVKDLCTAYKREWVKGNAKYTPTTEELKTFESIYRQAEKIFV
jgi:hypothetical protein